MVRIADLPEVARDAYANMETPALADTPLRGGPPLAERRIGIVSSAGLVRRGELPFRAAEPGYRVLPDGLPDTEILMSHISVNFDRSGFAQDIELVFPRRRLHELAEAGVIGGVGPTHYAFMGATPPTMLEPAAIEVAERLRADGVDSAVLLPV